MTFLDVTVPFRRKLDQESGAISAEDDVAEHPLATPVESGDEAEVRNGRETIPFRLYIFAGLTGAAVAAVVGIMLSLYPLRANDDPRLLQAVHDTGDLTAAVQGLSDKVRTLETESVSSSQAADGFDGRLKTATRDVSTIQTTLAALVAEQRHGSDALAGVNAPALFGVAAVQLRDRIESGLPFDWELVNLRAIAGSEPALLSNLDRLAPLAPSGVATPVRLLGAMQTLIGEAGPGASLVEAGLGVISKVVGPNLVAPPTGDPVVLLRADTLLASGDLGGFIREMQALSPPMAVAASPVVAAARRRLMALDSANALLHSARVGLQHQVSAVMLSAPPIRP